MNVVWAIAYLLVGVFVAALITEEDERDGSLVLLVALWPIAVLFLVFVYALFGMVKLADWVKRLATASEK